MWPNETTMEELQWKSVQGATLRYGNRVLAVNLSSRGFEAAVYCFKEKQPGLGDIEWIIGLKEASKEAFKEGGQAMAWCFKKINA